MRVCSAVLALALTLGPAVASSADSPTGLSPDDWCAAPEAIHAVVTWTRTPAAPIPRVSACPTVGCISTRPDEE
jgi:hypothetical protein